jgi:hypothetical protein
MIAKRIGFICAVLHCLLFLVVLICVLCSPDGQRQLLWVPLGFIDFPLSYIAAVICSDAYFNWVQSLNNSIMSHVLFPLYWVHGPIGAIWWYFLPRLILPKKWGGIWGTKGTVEKIEV